MSYVICHISLFNHWALWIYDILLMIYIYIYIYIIHSFQGPIFFWQENSQSSIVWIIFAAERCLFPKKLVLAMHSFKVTIIISITDSEPSIHLTVLYIFLTLKFAAIQFHQRTFLERISEHKSLWSKLRIETSIYFQSSIDYIKMRVATWSSYFFAEIFFFRIPSCLEQLLFPNNCSLVTNASLISYLNLNTFVGTFSPE